MTLLFRSMSCRLGCDSANSPTSSSVWEQEGEYEETEEDEEYDFEEEEDDEIEGFEGPISTPLIGPLYDKSNSRREKENESGNGQFPILAFMAAALRKSLLVTCSVEREDSTNVSSLEISCPTNVRHISHVTFDRFKGFLGLPDEFQHDILKRVPSARSDLAICFFLLLILLDILSVY